MLQETVDWENVVKLVMSPFAVLVIDGRNEHGSHVLAVGPQSIAETDLSEILSETDGDGTAEKIISTAENIGFGNGSLVWAEFCWNAPQIDELGRVELAGYWEFKGINPDMTTAMNKVNLHRSA